MLRVQDLRNIVEGASPFWERENQCFTPLREGRPSFHREERLKTWKLIVAAGDEERFHDRLAFDNWTIQDARSLVGPVTLNRNTELPSWARLVQKLVNEYSLPRSIRATHEMPFHEVFEGMANGAIGELRHRSNFSHVYLSDELTEGLSSEIAAQLASILARPMAVELNIARIQGTLHGDATQDRYRSFIEAIARPEGLALFFKDYPVAARLFATAIQNWTRAINDLFMRLNTDFPSIQLHFGNGEEIGRLVHLSPPLSDPHHFGQSARKLTFESGLSLVYKPRSLLAERAFNKFIEWMNLNDPPLALRSYKMLNRSTHGWVEHIARSGCRTVQGINRFYTRVGMLSFLSYVFGVADLHYENIIAAGEHPIIVDLETILHPRMTISDRDDSEDKALRIIYKGVLQSAFLPRWSLGELDRRGYDVSGVAGEGNQELPFRHSVWRNLGTDQLAIDLQYGRTLGLENRPILNGEQVSAEGHIDYVIEGIRAMGEWTMRNRSVLLQDAGPLEAFSNVEVRYLFRFSQVYERWRARTLDPDCLGDGAERSIRLDIASQKMRGPNPSHLLSIARVERESLFRLDVPRFSAKTSSKSLDLPNGDILKNVFDEPSYCSLISGISNLTPSIVDNQVLLAQGALTARFLGHTASSTSSVKSNTGHETFDDAYLLTKVRSIADELRRGAIFGRDGTATWIGVEYLPLYKTFQFQPLSETLFGGRSGVALFLAAVASITRDDACRAVATAAAKSIVPSLIENRLSERRNRGGYTGLGSVIYALGKLAVLLESEELLVSATRLTDEVCGVNPDENRFDIATGCAGLILALLQLYSVSTKSSHLQLASAWGDHLLKHRNPSSKFTETDLNFAYGALGIGYSLLRLFEVTKDPKWLEPGLALANQEEGAHMSAEGIVTSKVDLKQCALERGGFSGYGKIACTSLAIPNRIFELQPAEFIGSVLPAGLTDDLGCSNLAIADSIATLKKQGDSQFLTRLSRELAIRSIAKMGTGGNTPTSIRFQPGLFHGLSGIGYAILRTLEPKAIGSPMLLK